MCQPQSSDKVLSWSFIDLCSSYGLTLLVTVNIWQHWWQYLDWLWASTTFFTSLVYFGTTFNLMVSWSHLQDNTPIHLTFRYPLAQPLQPTSALTDVALPRLPRAFRGPIARQAWVRQNSRNAWNKTVGFAYTVYFHLVLYWPVAMPGKHCCYWQCKLIPDTQIDILMLSFYPSQSLFPSLKFANSRSKLVVSPMNNSNLTRSPNIITFVQR